jgi:hypothetical protein
MLNNNHGVWSGVIWVASSQYVYIYGNYFYHNGYDPYMHDIYIKSQPDLYPYTMTDPINHTQYIYMGWNEHDHWTAALNPGAGDSRGGAYAIATDGNGLAANVLTDHIYIFDNYFHDGDSQPLYLTEINYTYVWNNIFANTNCNTSQIFVAGLDSNSAFYNNVFYNHTPASAPLVYDSHSGYQENMATWKNNIFYANSSQSYFYTESHFYSDHDLFYGNGNGSCTGGGVCSITNAVNADPRFVTNGSNFHLQSNSPAKDAGTSAVSSLVTTDYDGISRPQNSVYDIGAFEYDTGSPPPPSDSTRPSPPRNLRVQ